MGSTQFTHLPEKAVKRTHCSRMYYRLHSGKENLSDHPLAYGGPSCNVKTSCTLFCQCQTPFCFVVDIDIVLTVAPKAQRQHTPEFVCSSCS